MASSVLALRVAATLYSVFCLAHVVRYLGHITVVIGGFTIPLWISVVGMVLGAGLAAWMWIASCAAGHPSRS